MLIMPIVAGRIAIDTGGTADDVPTEFAGTISETSISAAMD